MPRNAMPAVRYPRALALVASLVLSIGGAPVAANATAGTPDAEPVPVPGTVLPGAVTASAPSPEGAVRELLVESGVELALDEFLAATRRAGTDGARRGAGDAPDADARVALIEDALERAFAPERLRPIVARHVLAASREGDVGTMLAHYRSDLGRRLRDAVRTRRPADDPAGHARFAATFGSRADDAERLVVLRDYVRDSDAAGLVARFLVETEITSLHAVFALVGEAGRPRFEGGVASATSAIEPLRAALAERLPPLLAYTYDDFSVDELRAMAAAELSEAGRRVTAGVFDGFREVTVAGNADFVARVRASMSLAELQEEI